MARLKSIGGPLILGIEGGGSRTVALLARDMARQEGRIETGPTNLKLMSDRSLSARFKEIARRFPSPAVVSLGLAGLRTESDRQRTLKAARNIWPRAECLATNDLETALAAAPGRLNRRSKATILILSGTGSCCYGRADSGRTVQCGGWGHLLGDKGSGYEISLRALKAVVYYFDQDGKWPALGERLLRALQLNAPNDLIGWVQASSKQAIAALAPEVFEAWRQHDRIAQDIVAAAAASLARDGLACARRLIGAGPVEFLLTGGIFQNEPRFAGLVSRALLKARPGSVIRRLRGDTAWGAVRLGLQAAKAPPQGTLLDREKEGRSWAWLREISLSESPTELRHPGSRDLDRWPLERAIAMMLKEDAAIPRTILNERGSLAKAIRWITRSFKNGGRLFYVGAGTSGRLGVLDASECPPTFSVPPEMVQGIIAGGNAALWKSVEGAEDNLEAGGEAIRFRGVMARDVVVGIAASGRTPFVWGALLEARARGAVTILLCFNPRVQIPAWARPNLVICPRVGAEILTGSTRLKCGTATKLILNIFTTLAMTRLGKVMGNLMVDLRATNVKLRARALRIVQELSGASPERARAALEQHGWAVRKAVESLKAEV